MRFLFRIFVGSIPGGNSLKKKLNAVLFLIKKRMFCFSALCYFRYQELIGQGR